MNYMHGLTKVTMRFFEGYVFTLYIFMYTLAKRPLVIVLFN